MILGQQWRTASGRHPEPRLTWVLRQCSDRESGFRLSQISKGRLTLTPELREMRNQTMLFVFGL